MNVDYAGCDPGLSGGFAVVSGDRIKYKLAMPTLSFTTKSGKTKREIDRAGVLSFLHTLPPHTPVAIEKQEAFRSQNISATCTTCRNYGLLLMALSASHLHITEISARKWHDFHRIVNNKKGEGVSTKIQAFEICKRLYPDENFRKTERSKVFHTGITDATLIANYCQLLFESSETGKKE